MRMPQLSRHADEGVDFVPWVAGLLAAEHVGEFGEGVGFGAPVPGEDSFAGADGLTGFGD